VSGNTIVVNWQVTAQSGSCYGAYDSGTTTFTLTNGHLVYIGTTKRYDLVK